jgi:hypothetical protein
MHKAYEMNSTAIWLKFIVILVTTLSLLPRYVNELRKYEVTNSKKPNPFWNAVFVPVRNKFLASY